MTEYGICPAFGYQCEYVAKVEAQAAEIEKLRRDHASAVNEANIAKARLKGVQKQWEADRAKIVAWLRSASNGSKTVKYGNLFADEIETKEHLK